MATTFESALVALFQAPFDDATVTNAELVMGYTATFSELTFAAADVALLVPTTQDLADRQTASDIFISACMAACFAALCEAMAAKASNADYKTAGDVATDATSIFNILATLAARALDADVRGQIAELYSRTSGILQDLEVTLPRIAALDVPAIPASVLSYLLYDTDAQLDTLVGLNPNLPPWLYDGRADVLVTV